MTESSEESNEEMTITTELEEEIRDDTGDVEEDDPEEAARLERLEVQLEEDSDLLQNSRDPPEKPDSEFQEEEKAEDEDCPFCEYMKLGPCGKSFSAWEKCTETAEKEGSNVFEKCNLVTGILTACMRTNVSYYGPVLEAQKGLDGPSKQPEGTVKLERNVEKNLASTEKQVEIEDRGALEVDD